MNGALISSVVHALRFSNDEAGNRADAGRAERHPCDFSHREWARSIGMLDRTGITLPFYARLLESHTLNRFPLQTVAAFEQRRRDNAQRMTGMLRTFCQAAEALQHAGVQFVCVKGFSLLPEYLQEPWQRHQIDFDLLIRPGEGLRAQTALERLGYKLTGVAGDDERRMRIPAARALAHDAYLYSPQESPAVELHSRFWEAGANELSLRCPDDVFERAGLHTLGLATFIRLSRPHAFLYQVLHVFRHFLGSWARLLWLYEIAAYLHRNGGDDALWQEVRTLFTADARLREAAALVLLTAKNLFACPIPPALTGVCTLQAGSPVELWISRYARRWLLTDMPGNKLNLLLQRHFFSDARVWRRYLAGRLAPRGKRPMLCEGIDPVAGRSLAYRAANLSYRVSRVWHHLSTNAGFAAESIAWKIHLRASPDAFSRSELRRGEA